MIAGGYYIKARKIQESEIAHAPPHVREIWDWLIKEANYTDHKKLNRGQVLTSYKEIQDGLHWMIGYRKETYSKWQCEIAMKWLTKRQMVTTKRTTRGMIITIENYETYQNPENYENHNGNHNRTTTEPQGTDTIRKEGKEGESKLNTLSDPPGSDDEVLKRKSKASEKIYQETRKCMPHARALADIVKSQKNVSVTPDRMRSWANEIRKLIYSSEKVSVDRVVAALEWYSENVGLEYVPLVESGKSFREKFTRLEAAMARGTSSKNRAKHGTRGRGKYSPNIKPRKI
jgi:hypothetical protein